MRMNVNKAVGKVCASCQLSCFKESCKRKNWQEKTYPPMPKVGKDIECPMMQFEAKKPVKADYDILGRLPISISDTIAICNKCKYVGDSDTIDGMINHCYDCPNHQIRESQEETMAEAMACL